MLITVIRYLTIFRGYLGKSQFNNEAELQLFTFSKNINSFTVPCIPCVINSGVINCSTIALCFNWNIQCNRKVAVHLEEVLEVMSTSVYTGLNPFSFIHKHFLQICL